MEPFTSISAGLSIGNGARTAAQSAVQISQSALRKIRLSAIAETLWISAEDVNADSGLTTEDIGNGETFLQSHGALPILGFLALTKVSPASPERDEILGTLHRAFREEVHRWNILTDRKVRNIPALWNIVNSIYDGGLPEAFQHEDLKEAVENFSEFINTPLNYGMSGEVAGTVYDKPPDKALMPPSKIAYLRKLRNLAQNIGKLVAAAELSRNLSELIMATGPSPVISHFETSNDLRFAELYVGRNFEDAAGRQLNFEEAIEAQGTFRIILRGAPGAGKSTFVSHLVQFLADPSNRQTPIPSVVIKCIHYSKNSWAEPLTTYMATLLHASFSISISADDVKDLLLTGQLAIIIDGLDEIGNSSQRAELVRRIQALVVQFPAMPVLLTARDEGYEQIALSPSLFRHLRLLEFGESELTQYCTNWFNAIGRPDLIDPFVLESEGIHDLRMNPLLLSLLCNLYSGSGYIPSNRRDVYSRCANLLFHKWDSHRQIRQSEIMPPFGDRLMAEIARIFYSSSDTVGRLDGRMIRQGLTRYMVANLAFAYEDAEHEARDFVDFCAGRAWFLRTVGDKNSSSSELEFTHRTFYEFFVAESLAARPPDEDTGQDRNVLIAKVVMDLYGRDRSSFLPELLVQAYDARNELGGSHVLKALCTLNAFSHLILRLMDGIILSTDSLTTAFNLITARWEKQGSQISTLHLLSLLSINRIARQFFVQHYFATTSTHVWHVGVADTWASMVLSGQYRDALAPWAPDFRTLIERFWQEWNTARRPALTNQLILLGYSPAPLALPWNYLSCGGSAGRVPGVVWQAIGLMYSKGAESLVTMPALGLVVNAVHSKIISQGWIPAYVLNALRGPLVDLARQRMPAGWPKEYDDELTEKLLITLFAIIVAVGDSSRDDYDRTIVDLSKTLPGSIASVVFTRRSGVGNSDDQERAMAMLARMPDFFRGRLSR